MKYYNIEIPHRDIIAALEKELIQPNEGLIQVYTNLISYFLKANSCQPAVSKAELMQMISNNTLHKTELATEFEDIKNNSIRTMAIDLPIKLRSLRENVNKTIMVVAMDPLPPNTDQDETTKNKIGTWVPFSLIDGDFTGGKSFRSNRAFFLELLKRYHVYVTDIYKLFYREGNHPSDIRSNSLNRYTSIENHQVILNKEIDFVKPKVIVTMGNPSRNALYTIKGYEPKAWEDIQINYWDKTPIISIPHMSGAANKTSFAILKKYPELTGSKTEKLAKLVLSKFEDLGL